MPRIDTRILKFWRSRLPSRGGSFFFSLLFLLFFDNFPDSCPCNDILPAYRSKEKDCLGKVHGNCHFIWATSLKLSTTTNAATAKSVDQSRYTKHLCIVLREKINMRNAISHDAGVIVACFSKFLHQGGKSDGSGVKPTQSFVSSEAA